MHLIIDFNCFQLQRIIADESKYIRDHLLFITFLFSNILHCLSPARAQRSPRMRKVGGSNPSRDRPKSLKQVVTALLLDAQH